ncbi:MAG: iron oxidase oxidoreductase [Sulfurimonas sp. RIFOXYD12_FULL_33_39]|uniref:iron oxidase oxidoreductase n=1 Tax=unclassified Sulfurimonas TaxID=2623549 RepID=UPI0008B3BA2E|nr:MULTISPECIES: iron oxidase oxidoreductase [unclassified Sulfurimonas]OHE10968.1 MAG: iron oxidase oxidoreductase [Sulfurimonas sp. RIFOXYD12_FULL_33_39]OHE13263.1 MAG: iron oxidase oxidoreductase [Sulfurimonas sp. RIFOXYD2_FULL_34_21]
MKFSTRRVFLKYMAILGLGVWSTTPLYAKAAKDKLKYQDTPKDGKKCVDCVHFLAATNECKVVDGSISPDGWCMIYLEAPKK